jgi:hypothetical protein
MEQLRGKRKPRIGRIDDDKARGVGCAHRGCLEASNNGSGTRVCRVTPIARIGQEAEVGALRVVQRGDRGEPMLEVAIDTACRRPAVRSAMAAVSADSDSPPDFIATTLCC